MIKLDMRGLEGVAEWDKWREDCERAQAELIDAVKRGENVSISAKTYSRMKEKYYLAGTAPFFGKCAFCEQLIRANQHGDIEHYRPKGGVTDANDDPVEHPETGRQHPGYYWLAYDWKNLLPSCQLCNQPSSSRGGGRRLGKWNQFPLTDEGARAYEPGEEVGEEPLLIHPGLDEPADHIAVDESGVLFAVNGSARGAACIAVFGLNDRTELVAERQQAMDDARMATVALVTAIMHNDTVAIGRLKERLDRIDAGAVQYAMAARAGAGRIRERLLADISAVLPL